MQDYAAGNDYNEKWRRRTFPFETSDVFVGKDRELEHLLSLVVDDEAHRVISLWGMGGVGKTAIVRKVYNHHRTKNFFESFAWVCVSQECQIRSILEDVLKQLKKSPHQNSSNLSDTKLLGQLWEIQQAKKCLIVIDDIWKTEHWDGLNHALNFEGTKTKILLTTRKQNIANIGFAIKTGLLNDNDGWELLKRKALPHINIQDFRFEETLLEKIGKEMVGKCGNLPLVISLLGRILSKKKTKKEWELVNQNISTYLYRGVENVKDEIHEVLYLSYQDLPYYLKPCFLYMGLYKEDEDIDAIDICLMWIAQGMILHENHSDKDNLMDIAQDYLSELASRSVVEIIRDDPIRGQRTRSCTLHKVMRQLCLSVAKEKEDFGLRNLDYEGGTFSSFWHNSLTRAKTRHLIVNLKSIIQEENKVLTITCDEDTTKFVQSLIFINDMAGVLFNEFPHNVVDLKKFKMLKTLSICGLIFEGGKLPKEISDLIMLRILRLRDCMFDELPSSVSNLLYLHTLDLWNSENILIPHNVLNKMLNLKHLFLPAYYEAYYAENIESNRLSLEGLEQLETLVGFNSLVHQLESPAQMTNLRHFEGTVHDNQSLSDIIHAFCTSWKDCRCGGLKIKQGCHISSEEDLMIFKKLFNLHNMYIFVPIEKLFKELENQVYTSNLMCLILSESEIMEDPMETLGKLPLLLDLLITDRCFLGEEITCYASSFPRLENLGINDLPNLREWKVEKGAMPLVSKMGIHYCPRLEMVPDGFRFLDALTDLHLYGMPELGERICEEGGEDFHKVRHVRSIVVRD